MRLRLFSVGTYAPVIRGKGGRIIHVLAWMVSDVAAYWFNPPGTEHSIRDGRALGMVSH